MGRLLQVTGKLTPLYLDEPHICAESHDRSVGIDPDGRSHVLGSTTSFLRQRLPRSR